MMLADFSTTVQVGRLQREVHLPGTAPHALLQFITSELPRWRDDPERRAETSETVLTDHLCDHLNSAARTSAGWSWVQFRTEVPDEANRGRAIDLALKPCGVVVVVGGRRHTQYDTLLPIECKRLPTPKGTDRDEREYVVTATGTTGGIQRFKFGHHGAKHAIGGMIAYVQQETAPHWLAQVNRWIQGLSCEANSGWSVRDRLQRLRDDAALGICTLRSRHERTGGLAALDLQHLWIRMN